MSVALYGVYKLMSLNTIICFNNFRFISGAYYLFLLMYYLWLTWSTVQLLMGIIESMSAIPMNGVTKDLEKRNWASLDQESEKDLEAALPDGNQW